MKNRAYDLTLPSEAARTLAKKITALVVSSAVTYQEAMDALDVTADELAHKTVPVIPQQSD